MFVRSILSLMLGQARERRKPSIARDGYQTPLLAEWPVEGADPMLSTGTAGSLRETTRTREGNVRLAFFQCSVEGEASWLASALVELLVLSESHGWANRYSSVREGLVQMPGCSHILVPPGVSGADELASVSLLGSLGEVEGLRTLPVETPSGKVVLVGPPAMSGVAIRSDDQLAVSLWRVSSCWGFCDV